LLETEGLRRLVKPERLIRWRFGALGDGMGRIEEVATRTHSLDWAAWPLGGAAEVAAKL